MIAKILVGLVALIHFYFMFKEMFLWPDIVAMLELPFNEDVTAQTAVLGFNQGLYNGFLAAGLALTLLLPALFNRSMQVFLLICIVVAGVLGWTSADALIILLAQAVPAALALVAVLLFSQATDRESP